MNRVNRNLTNADVKNAEYVLVQVYVDDNYPMFVTLEGEQLENIKNIDDDNTRRVKNWRFEITSVEGSVEHKELSDCEHFNDEKTNYGIVVGQAGD